jgi:hypothetical protein
MTSAAERQRRRRQRGKNGLSVIPTVVDEVALIEQMVAAGYLKPALAYCEDTRRAKQALADALSQAVRDLKLVDFWPTRHV